MLNRKKLVFVVNVDWFFISHRLPLALEGKKRGFDVYVVGKDTGLFKKLSELGITCIPIEFERSGKKLFKEIAIIRKLKQVYKQINPDIIHQITLKPSIYGTIALSKLKHKAKVLNAVSGLGYSFTDDRKNLSKLILVFLLKKAFANKKSNFIFQNPDDMQFYQSLGFLTDNNYQIIKGSGVDKVIFSYRPPVHKNKLKVVLVSRMLFDKGVMEFISAAKILKPIYQHNVEFEIFGGIDIDNPAHITEKTITTNTDGAYIKWHGHASDIKSIYEQSDVVCLPSYREGLPKSLVEAMAIGRPIITTDAPGCRECVVQGKNGYLVPIKNSTILADRLNELLSNEELRLNMGLASRAIMEKEMSLNTVIDLTYSFYERIN